MNKLKTKLRKLTSRSWSVAWEYRCLKMKQIITGWVNYYRIGNFKTQCREIDKWVIFRIRMYLWKKWKTIKNREKQLRKLGVYPWQAKTWECCRKGYVRCAATFLHIVRNDLLKRKGLPSMVDQYQLKHI